MPSKRNGGPASAGRPRSARARSSSRGSSGSTPYAPVSVKAEPTALPDAPAQIAPAESKRAAAPYRATDRAAAAQDPPDPKVRPSDNEGQLEAEIARLGDLGLAELRARWLSLYGRPAPKFFRRNLVLRGVAYQMQVKGYGGLSATTKRRLRQIAEAAREGTEESVIGTLRPRLKPGTRLIRVWQDKPHSVTVLADGFEWEGRRYGSLSAVAKVITGTSWNGHAFFGVKKRPGRNKNAAKRKEPKDAREGASRTISRHRRNADDL